jgi:polyhydroxyalkanoate synthesis regulator phasin
VKLTRNTIVIPLAALMLVGAAGAVLATTSGPTDPGAQAPAAATPTPTPSSGTTTRPDAKDDALTTVLDDLVAKGTVTEAQKKAILDGVATERTSRMAARKAARDEAIANWQQIRDFLSDGVITKDEFDKLPADSPLRKLTTLMDDGKITTDELKALGQGLGGGFLGGGHGFRGHGWGGGWGGGKGMSPDASPSPSAGTSG